MTSESQVRTKHDKPLGTKNYGSIGHLPNSRMGEGDHHIEEGQGAIATSKRRNSTDEVIVQEKLDGSNVGVARIGGRIIALSRAGYPAYTSPFPQHQAFDKWVMQQQDRFSFLNEGERLVGEWLMQAHGTRYELKHEPFVVFDIMRGIERETYDTFLERVQGFITPYLIHRGDPISVEDVMKRLGTYGFHGALDEVEGAVWRVEAKNMKAKGNPRRVEFLCKYVRPDKVDGTYMKLEPPVLNWTP